MPIKASTTISESGDHRDHGGLTRERVFLTYTNSVSLVAVSTPHCYHGLECAKASDAVMEANNLESTSRAFQVCSTIGSFDLDVTISVISPAVVLHWQDNL